MKKIYNFVLDIVFYILRGFITLAIDMCKAVYKFGKYFYDGVFTK